MIVFNASLCALITFWEAFINISSLAIPGGNLLVEKYPKNEANDLELLRNAVCDAVFIPSKHEIENNSDLKSVLDNAKDHEVDSNPVLSSAVRFLNYKDGFHLP